MNGATETQECRLTTEGFRRDLLRGLSAQVKHLPSKYLYDEEGARLFEQICNLEEYYPTRTEMGILQRNAPEIASLLGPRCNLVELGSGGSTKTQLLLDTLEHAASYVPIDVAQAQLLEVSAGLALTYPNVEVLPVCADFTKHFFLPVLPRDSHRTAVFFPGSTIGNFEPHEAELLLSHIAGLCGRGTRFLIGVDLKKDPDVLHRAYNDADGVTADFNRNILGRANRELKADFSIALFQHHAFYNQQEGRIEMHLLSECPQTVRVGEARFDFAQRTSIRTEYSYKYTLGEFRCLAQRAGFDVARCWTDSKQWFSVQYLVPQGNREGLPANPVNLADRNPGSIF
jgi:dimethylhistidine N-methyltransferase